MRPMLQMHKGCGTMTGVRASLADRFWRGTASRLVSMGRPVGVSKFSRETTELVERLAFCGATHREIARQTGVSKSMVGYMLKRPTR